MPYLVHKDIILTVIRRDEAEAFTAVEPFDDAGAPGRGWLLAHDTQELGLCIASWQTH